MKSNRLGRATIAAITLLILLAGKISQAQVPERWIASWATALCPQTTAPAVMTPEGMTIRNIVHLSAGGSQIRLKFSNEFGADPLTIGEAAVALVNDKGDVQGDAHPITFAGKPQVTLPQGAIVLSDPVTMPVAALANLSVSFFLPAQPIRMWTRHPLAVQSNAIAPGNQAAKSNLSASTSVPSSFFLKAVDVACNGHCATIAALGDSITDGLGSAMGKNRRWPDALAARFAADTKTRGIGVVNLGISGNRLLHEGAGPSVLARLDRDVLAQSGVEAIILLEGINDIGVATRAKDPADPVTAEDLEWSLRQVVTRAHDAGVKVYAATLTPAGRRADNSEEMRLKFNAWIRTCNLFDGVVDFDLAVRDPKNPRKMLEDADSGDSLHPGDHGYKRMADAVELSSFYNLATR